MLYAWLSLEKDGSPHVIVPLNLTPEFLEDANELHLGRLILMVPLPFAWLPLLQSTLISTCGVSYYFKKKEKCQAFSYYFSHYVIDYVDKSV